MTIADVAVNVTPSRQKQQKEWLSRKEAAAYLNDLGQRISAQHLANMASNSNSGGGPPFDRVGWCGVRYARADLDAWAQARVKRVP